MEFVFREAQTSSDFFKLFKLRNKVYVEELNVPKEIEFDEYDKIALHFIVEFKDITIGTARLVVLGKKGKIGRVCILKEYRKKGIGTKLIKSIIKTAKKIGLEKLIVEAKVKALPFYEKIGFHSEGNEFLEVGIPHKKMSLSIIN
jgi:predicted GNAT family N-acyltransferase